VTPINVHRHGRVEAIAYVDDADIALVSRWKWQLTPGGYAQACGGKYMHRIILEAQKGQYVDHINRDGLMNVRGNLRIVTQSQNLKNQLRPGRIVGVRLTSSKKTWEASMMTNGKVQYLGRFTNKLDAISARFAAVRSYWSSQALPVPAAIEQLYLNALDVA
jgi:hypothetical protein